VDPEIAAHRLLDLPAVAHQHSGERPEQLLALLQRGEGVGSERGALALDDLLQLGDRRGVVGCGRGGLLGGHHARLLRVAWAALTLRRIPLLRGALVCSRGVIVQLTKEQGCQQSPFRRAAQ
jgi:hypothetical protein